MFVDRATRTADNGTARQRHHPRRRRSRSGAPFLRGRPRLAARQCRPERGLLPDARAVFALWSRTALAEDARVPAAPGGVSGSSLAYNCRSTAEVDAILAEAKVAGAKILKPAADTFWGGYSG